MEQLLCHAVGDYLLQADWFALNKKKWGIMGDLACLGHVWLYTTPFWLLTTSPTALFVIFFSHFLIDRTNVAAWLTWARNWMNPPWINACDCGDNEECARCGKMISNRSWKECKDNFGFDPSRPFAVVFPISVVIDNTLHLVINYCTLRWL